MIQGEPLGSDSNMMKRLNCNIQGMDTPCDWWRGAIASRWETTKSVSFPDVVGSDVERELADMRAVSTEECVRQTAA
jgi:hypothetical protein